MKIHMKKCSSCHQEKHIDLFHKDKTTKTGCSTYCKSCKKKKDKLAQRKKPQEKAKKDAWRKKFPEKKNAQAKVFRALLSGKLTKQPCFICGEKAEAHHPDYSSPLDVVWLCPSHHREAHNNI